MFMRMRITLARQCVELAGNNSASSANISASKDRRGWTQTSEKVRLVLVVCPVFGVCMSLPVTCFPSRADLLHAFSDEEVNYGEGESEKEEEEGEVGLDLLTAMLNAGSTKKTNATKAVSRKRSSVCEGGGHGAPKRRRMEEKEEVKTTETAESSTDDVSLMKGKLVYAPIIMSMASPCCIVMTRIITPS